MWKEDRGFTDVIGYSTLRLEFTYCFGSNEFRTIAKYIGHPAFTTVVKPKRGRSFKATVKKKVGLLETLGYITQIDDLSTEAYYHLNWEKVQRINVCASIEREIEREERRERD